MRNLVGSNHEVFLAQYEVAAEVLGAHDVVGGELLGRSLEEDASFEQQVCPVGYRQRFLNVMICDENPDVLVFQTPHDALDVFDGNRVDASEGLVEHDELRVDGEASGNLGTSALASRELVALVLAHLLEVELGDEALELLLLLLAADVLAHLQHGDDVVLDSHLTEDAGFLRQVADAFRRALVDGEPGDVLVVDENLSSVGGDKACRHVEGCRLAGTVRAQQTNDFSLAHVD